MGGIIWQAVSSIRGKIEEEKVGGAYGETGRRKMRTKFQGRKIGFGLKKIVQKS